MSTPEIDNDIIDPDRALALLRRAAGLAVNPGYGTGSVTEAQRAARFAYALDRHITAGGPLPADWRPDRRAPAQS